MQECISIWQPVYPSQSLKKNPREVGQNILKSVTPSPLIAKLELSGPGFINITISQDFIRQQVTCTRLSSYLYALNYCQLLLCSCFWFQFVILLCASY